MTLREINITLPKEIPHVKAARMIEESLRRETNYKVFVEYKYGGGEESKYRVWVDHTHAFYYLGLTVATIIEEFNKLPQKPIFPIDSINTPA